MFMQIEHDGTNENRNQRKKSTDQVPDQHYHSISEVPAVCAHVINVHSVLFTQKQRHTRIHENKRVPARNKHIDLFLKTLQK